MRDEQSASQPAPDEQKPPGAAADHSARPQADARPRRPRRSVVHAPAKDISPVLKGWDYENGTLNVRKITGLDGAPKLQMRVSLGLLQMELNGRPDGQRPHGYESLLEYFERQLSDHQERNGNDRGFRLSAPQCESLREEAAMYYQRYLSLFVLGEFTGVVSDTARNLRVLDLCGHYAATEQDRLILEQYRPYLVMMHTRAAASIDFQAKRYTAALGIIDNGLREIRDFFSRFGHEGAFNQCSEVKVLKQFARDIRRRLPVDPVQKLQRRLDRAVKEERYEDAARLRDEINELKKQPA
jgi:hypothetical protein